MAVDGVTASGGVQGGGTSGNVPVFLDSPVSLLNGGTGVSAFSNAQLVNSIGALPTAGGSMSGDLTVHGGVVVGDPADGNLGAGTVNIKSLLEINNSTALSSSAPVNTRFHIEDDASARALITAYGGSATLTLRSAGGTGAMPAATPSGHEIGIISFAGHTDTNWLPTGRRAGISVVAAETWTGLAQGTRMRFETTPPNSISNDVRAEIGQGLVVGNPSSGDIGPGMINCEGVYVNGTAVAAGGAGLPMEGGIISDPAGTGDLLTIRTSNTVAQMNRIIFDQPYTNAAGNAAQQWAVGSGPGGSFGVWHTVGGSGTGTLLAINAANDQLQIWGDLDLRKATGMHYILRDAPAGNLQIGFAAAGGNRLEVFEINSDDVVITGDLEAGGTPVVSDRRLKQNIEPWERGLAAVRQLNPIRYEYNARAGWLADGRMRVGLDADETGEVIPEMVGTRRSGELDGTPVKTIAPDVLLFALTNAVKELASRLEALEGNR